MTQISQITQAFSTGRTTGCNGYVVITRLRTAAILKHQPITDCGLRLIASGSVLLGTKCVYTSSGEHLDMPFTGQTGQTENDRLGVL